MCALFDEVEGPLASPWFQRAPLGVIRRRESRLEDLSGCELVPRILVVVPCRRGFISIAFQEKLAAAAVRVCCLPSWLSSCPRTFFAAIKLAAIVAQLQNACGCVVSPLSSFVVFVCVGAWASTSKGVVGRGGRQQ